MIIIELNVLDISDVPSKARNLDKAKRSCMSAVVYRFINLILPPIYLS